MCGKSVTTPDSKRGKTENGPSKSEKIKKLEYVLYVFLLKNFFPNILSF